MQAWCRGPIPPSPPSNGVDAPCFTDQKTCSRRLSCVCELQHMKCESLSFLSSLPASLVGRGMWGRGTGGFGAPAPLEFKLLCPGCSQHQRQAAPARRRTPLPGHLAGGLLSPGQAFLRTSLQVCGSSPSRPLPPLCPVTGIRPALPPRLSPSLLLLLDASKVPPPHTSLTHRILS